MGAVSGGEHEKRRKSRTLFMNWINFSGKSPRLADLNDTFGLPVDAQAGTNRQVGLGFLKMPGQNLAGRIRHAVFFCIFAGCLSDPLL